MSSLEFSDDAELLYQGSAIVGNYGRSIKTRQYFTLTDIDQAQFEESLKKIDGNTPVLVTLGAGEDMLFNLREFLLTRASQSKRQNPTFRLECDDDDDALYYQTQEWADAKVELFATIIVGQVGKADAIKTGEYSALSRRFRRSDHLNSIPFLQAVGSEKKYMRFIRHQKCCISNQFYKDLATGEEWCDPAHVREIRTGAGVAEKPPYMVVPLHHDLHEWSHRNSMTELWLKEHVGKGFPRNNHYRRLHKNQEYPIQSPKEAAHLWFRHKAYEHQRKWVIQEVLDWAGVKRLSWVSPEKLHTYLTQRGAVWASADIIGEI